MLAKWFVDRFGVEFFFELTDDEKFLVKEGYSLEDTNRLAYENALDLIALGFDPKHLHLIIDTEDISLLYGIAVRIGKHLTLSTLKHTFGFTDSTNVGAAFFPTLEIAMAFLPSRVSGGRGAGPNTDRHRSRPVLQARPRRGPPAAGLPQAGHHIQQVPPPRLDRRG